MEKILILGGTGNIGTPLVDILSTEKKRIRVASRVRPADLDEDLDWVKFDFFDPNSYRGAFEDVRRLFLLTPITPSTAQITALAVKAAEEFGVDQIVKISALNAGPRATYVFGKWHHEAESLIAKSRVKYTILRPNGFMQNFLAAPAAQIRTQGMLFAPIENGRVSFIDTRDIAASAAAILEAAPDAHHRQVYDLTGPAALGYQDIADILSRASGRTIRYLSVSDSDAARAMTGAGLPDWLVTALLELYVTYKVGEAADVSSSVEEITGRAPGDFERFAEEHQAAFAV